MAEVNAQTIRHLYDAIVVALHLPRPDNSAVDVQLNALSSRFDIIVPQIPGNCLGQTVSPGDPTWDSLKPEERGRLYKDLTELLQSIQALTGPRAVDPDSLMFNALASGQSIVLLFAYAVIMVLLLGWGIMRHWESGTAGPEQAAELRTSTEIHTDAMSLKSAVEDLRERRETVTGIQQKPKKEQGDDWTRQLDAAETEVLEAEIRLRNAVQTAGQNLLEHSGPTETVVLLLVTMLGALGGTLRLLSSLVRYIGNRELRKSWISYYVFMPVQGAILAPIVYLLLRIGILAPSVVGESGTAHLNLLSIYAFAALTGLFTNQAMVKLRDIFVEIFRSRNPEDKDSLTSHRVS